MAEMAEEAQKGHGSKKPARPNFNKIHAKSLPLETYPLPAFIPHNPVSALRIAYFVLSQFLFRPHSHPSIPHKAYLSYKTRSIDVTDNVSIRMLWEQGFFGKGTLSRSEPSWLDRERRRRGLSYTETAEEITERRRVERREMKKERARKEKELIEEQLKKEGSAKVLPVASTLNGITASANGSSEPVVEAGHETEAIGSKSINIDAPDDRVPLRPTDDTEAAISNSQAHRASLPEGRSGSQEQDVSIENQEHLQLSYEEAFFLAYGLGVLQVFREDTQQLLSNIELLLELRRQSYFPARLPSSIEPDDPFLVNYVAYHHFRSHGWVIRSGIKFAVDYLLYNRGPVFSHAEFAVITIPSFRDPYWTAVPQRAAETQKRSARPWWWSHGVNRVQAQVRKTLVLVYVEIPPPEPDSQVGRVEDIGRMLKRYKVREFAVKRWTPNRNRD
ncbi:MAG: hypothetical protein M1820_001535 [Bogoriella megaspora]|nr:MAG: hypothetical protein M1820_001535 [Bogoriella megaspora]